MSGLVRTGGRSPGEAVKVVPGQEVFVETRWVREALKMTLAEEDKAWGLPRLCFRAAVIALLDTTVHHWWGGEEGGPEDLPAVKSTA